MRFFIQCIVGSKQRALKVPLKKSYLCVFRFVDKNESQYINKIKSTKGNKITAVTQANYKFFLARRGPDHVILRKLKSLGAVRQSVAILMLTPVNFLIPLKDESKTL